MSRAVRPAHQPDERLLWRVQLPAGPAYRGRRLSVHGGLLVVPATNRAELAANCRMRQQLRGLDRLSDLDELVEQEAARGSAAP